MGKKVFDHAVRILACQSCGAPMDTSVEGGTFKCSYCSAVNQLVHRDEQTDRDEAQQARDADISESERAERLKQQADRVIAPPKQVLRFLIHGQIPEDKKQNALDEWVETRAEVVDGATLAVAERLFFLTLYLVPILDDRHQRALLESAIEALPDARFRQVLRCRLSRHAALAGELDAAQAWLDVCNPRPLDLLMDTEYRVATAILATGHQDWRTISRQIGRLPEDAPIMTAGHEILANVLRVNLHEKKGDLDTANILIRDLISNSIEMNRIWQLLQENEPLQLCPKSFANAESKLLVRAQQQLMPSSRQASYRSTVLWTLGFLISTVLIITVGIPVWQKTGSFTGAGLPKMIAGFAVLCAPVFLIGAFLLFDSARYYRKVVDTYIFAMIEVTEVSRVKEIGYFVGYVAELRFTAEHNDLRDIEATSLANIPPDLAPGWRIPALIAPQDYKRTEFWLSLDDFEKTKKKKKKME